MNEKDKQKLKALKKWWKSCPSKKFIFILTLLITFIAFNYIYDIGYAIGKFLYYIGV